MFVAAQQTNFQPSHPARALRSGCSNTLGWLIPELPNLALASLAHTLVWGLAGNTDEGLPARR